MTEGGKARAIDRGPAAKGRIGAEETACLDLADDGACRRLVCAGFCTFYKPSPPLEERCGGLAAVERRFAAASSDPGAVARLRAALQELVEADDPVSYRFDDEIAGTVCHTCPFVSGGDCAHRDPTLAPEERLEPCGGYILLAALLEAGVFE